MEQKGVTIWLTGMSGAGKTALAIPLEQELKRRGLKVERLDGDIVRQSLTRDLGFSKEDRDKNIERVTFVAKLLTRNGVATICSFISPYRAVRARVREEVGNFVEVYCYAPLDVLIERDVKGLYKKALAGEIENFTGISDPYEPPENPEVMIDSSRETIEESLAKILQKLEELGYVPPLPAEEEAYTEDEEAEIEARLAALGYL
ncbi:MAG TPA: adenylyl-sulfate kinase [Anaerolineae bacterium]|nr:adenylyl-sulfate kinase [Anaerolineae bacterium]